MYKATNRAPTHRSSSTEPIEPQTRQPTRALAPACEPCGPSTVGTGPVQGGAGGRTAGGVRGGRSSPRKAGGAWGSKAPGATGRTTCAGARPLREEDFAVEASLVGPLRPFGPPPPEGGGHRRSHLKSSGWRDAGGTCTGRRPRRWRTLMGEVLPLQGSSTRTSRAHGLGQPRPSRSERERQRTKRRIWHQPIDSSSPEPIDANARQPTWDPAPAFEPCEPSPVGTGPAQGVQGDVRSAASRPPAGRRRCGSRSGGAVPR